MSVNLVLCGSAQAALGSGGICQDKHRPLVVLVTGPSSPARPFPCLPAALLSAWAGLASWAHSWKAEVHLEVAAPTPQGIPREPGIMRVSGRRPNGFQFLGLEWNPGICVLDRVPDGTGNRGVEALSSETGSGF